MTNNYINVIMSFKIFAKSGVKKIKFHSIRTKITAIALSAMAIVMTIATVFGVFAIKNIGGRKADQELSLLCETGQKNLNHYFESVEQSVAMVSAYVESDLNGLDDQHLQAHLNRVEDIFQKLTYKTFGMTTYYYRIDPAVSEQVKGFWYVNIGDGFTKHEVTDISAYDTNDTSKLVWFTVPKASGKAVWLPPYVTDNLDVRVISYNVPIYFQKTFVGVIGIEIDYSNMAEEINHITLYENGYAFLNDSEGNIIYHPHIDVTKLKTQPKVPDGLVSDNKNVTYTYDGVEKQAVWLPLSNGMRLNVTVPVSEINAGWHNWTNIMLLSSVLLLVAYSVLLMMITGRITKPLRKLTEAAEQLNKGKYDFNFEYSGNDEIGILTQTFKKMSANLGNYITDLNDLAYADALTSLHNKGAFDIHMKDIQTKLNAPTQPEFAVCIFDCNRLKHINDQNGHDKGDIYLKEASSIICEVFAHSPVFRIGGDEFAALLLDKDYQNRDALLKLFDERCSGKRDAETHAWKKVDVARGMAIFDPSEDNSVDDVIRRADKKMYENKWLSKNKQAKTDDN